MLFVRTNLKLPENKGRLDIYPGITDGDGVGVDIIGDPDGLRYLSDVLRALAGYDQDSDNAPVGTREHVHLHRECQLGGHSCEVVVSRADAKGTGELPDFMKQSRRDGDKES